MPKYIVTRKEIHEQMVEIEAEDEESALEKAADGLGTLMGTAEFYEFYPTGTWSVEKAP